MYMLQVLVVEQREWKEERIIIIYKNQSVPST